VLQSAKIQSSRAASTPTTPLQEIIEWRESVAEGRGSETRGWQCLFFSSSTKIAAVVKNHSSRPDNDYQYK
jgi:hypothetical protein